MIRGMVPAEVANGTAKVTMIYVHGGVVCNANGKWAKGDWFRPMPKTLTTAVILVREVFLNSSITLVCCSRGACWGAQAAISVGGVRSSIGTRIVAAVILVGGYATSKDPKTQVIDAWKLLDQDAHVLWLNMKHDVMCNHDAGYGAYLDAFEAAMHSKPNPGLGGRRRSGNAFFLTVDGTHEDGSLLLFLILQFGKLREYTCRLSGKLR